MSTFLLKLLELSLQAGALTLGILLVRLIFRRLPAKYLCLLWAIVAVRLVVPFSFESVFAWAPNLQTLWSGEEEREYSEIYTEFISIQKTRYDSEGNVIEKVKVTESDDAMDFYLNGSSKTAGTVTDIYAELVDEHHTVITNTDSGGETDYYLLASPTPIPDGIANAQFRLDWRELFYSVTPVLFVLWLLGMVILLGYGVFSCIRVKWLVKNAIPYKDNIWLCEGLPTPFLFGWRNPQIYLPTNLEEDQIRYVILHEKAHIARKDNYFKLIGFLLLAIYWFNPLIWVAYVLFCKDVERACDEKVISGLDGDGRKGYAEALLECSVERKFTVSNPLAFGEMDVKKRITGILKYKKPGKWIAAFVMLLCVAAVAGCFFVKEEGPGLTAEPTPTVTATPIPTVAPTNPPRGEGPHTPTPYVWAQTITHIPSDLERVESDLDLLGITTPETLVAVPMGQTVVADLNGDGAEESVTFGLRGYTGNVSYNKIMHDSFFLKIDETVVLQGEDDIFQGESPCFTTYYLFDIDVTDGYKEIGLADYGPNGDVGIALYRYDKGSVQCIGGFRSAPLDSDNPWKMNGYKDVSYEEMVAKVPRDDFLISVPGDGTIWAEERDFLLGNCSVVKKYQLENASSGTEARLKAARRGHYVFNNWDWEGGISTTAAYEFKAFVSDCLDDEKVVIVPEGSEVTFYDYYLSAEEWGKGHVRFFYTVEEKWDSVGWLILSSDGIVMPRSSDTEPFETVEPTELFHDLNMAG